MSATLKRITNEAKRMRKANPNSKKKWVSYVKEAAQKIKSGKVKRKPTRKKVVRKKAVIKKAVKVRRKKATVGKVKKPVYSVTHKVRRVGKAKGFLDNPLLIGAVAVLGFYFYKTRTRKDQSTANSQSNQTLPALDYTADVQRNSKMEDLVKYATAIGLAGTALTNFIKNLNSSNNTDLDNLKNTIDSGAGIPSNWV